MQIFVKVKTGVKQEKIVPVRDENTLRALAASNGICDSYFEVSVKDRPISGKANIAVIKALAEYLDIAPSQINIVRGLTSRNKVFEII